MPWPGLSRRRSPEKTRPAITSRCAAARDSASPRSTSATSSRVLAIDRLDFRRRRPMLGRDRAHETHCGAIGILDDGITSAPEGVERCLQATMAGGRHLGVETVDLLARGHAETDDHLASEIRAAAPSGVPDLGE